MNKTVTDILSINSGEKFYRFGNADGKKWIMPVRNMRTAMGLYQPSGTKGKAVKSLLPYLHPLPFVRNVIKAETLHCHLQEELHQLLGKLFISNHFEFSIFEGTPSVHQKITMQVSKGKKILGYCKLSKSSDIKKLFEEESAMLGWLAKKKVNNIPQTLYCGTLTNGIHIFVQSTVKSPHSTTIHKWGTLQEEFLAQLHHCTKQHLPFEGSDYSNTINALEANIALLPDNINHKTVETAIKAVRKEFCGKDVEFSACHGDFTPWNMFAEKDKLFVFDFEYAAKSYPPGLDRYHYFTQTAIFEKRLSAQEIISLIQSAQEKWIKKKEYKLYLLDIISRFTLREGKKVTGCAAAPFATWGALLEYLTTEE